MTSHEREKRSVVVVDDDGDFCASLADVLAGAGYEVTSAATAREALARAGDAAAHVFLVDVRLGKDSGTELVRTLLREEPRSLCITMTAYAGTDTAIRALKAGAYDYLVKPIEPEDRVPLPGSLVVKNGAVGNGEARESMERRQVTLILRTSRVQCTRLTRAEYRTRAGRRQRERGSRMGGRIIFEACVDSVDAAAAAQEGGADRVELCADLLEGGCTPSAGVIRLARQRLTNPLHVIIRPRGGDFCYSKNELQAMEMDVEFAREAGADGVVVGVLREDGTVDTERTGELVRRARPMAVTFHRAFDMTRDPLAALEALAALGIERVLTSGQEATAFEGAELIADLVAGGAGRIIVMPGGGITERNAAKILLLTGASEVHAAVISSIDGRMRFRNARCHMGGELRPPEFDVSVTYPGAVRQLRAALG